MAWEPVTERCGRTSRIQNPLNPTAEPSTTTATDPEHPSKGDTVTVDPGRDGQRIFQLKTYKRRAMMHTVGRLNTHAFVCLNDTGADVSVLNLKTAKTAGLEILPVPQETVINNPNGKPFVIEGMVKTDIEFEGSPFEFRAYVLRDLGENVILGADFLDDHDAVLSYGERAVAYGEHVVKTVYWPRYESKQYKRTDLTVVKSVKQVFLTPGSSCMLDLEVPERAEDPGMGQVTWTFQPLRAIEEAYGVTMLQTLVGVTREGYIQVLVANMTGKPVAIPEGTPMGKLRTLAGEKAVNSIRTIHTPTSILGADGDVAINNLEGLEVPKEADTPEFKKQRREEFEKVVAQKVAELPEHLTDEEKRQFSEVLLEFQHVIYANKLGKAEMAAVDIQFKDGRITPVVHKERRMTHHEQEILRKQIKDLLTAGIIEATTSEWANRLVMVPKKGGETRICVDFRDLNKMCKKDSYPAPNIDGMLDQIGRARYYTALDLAKGYHQIPLTETAKDCSAFRCPFGHYRYTRLPFGMMNAPAAFQRLMDAVLKGIAWECCMVYLDDVIIFSDTWPEHVAHVRNVLERLGEAGLTLKLKKCQFGTQSIEYLGYRITPEGIYPDEKKVEGVRQFEKPAKRKDLQSFLGFAGVLRKFIKNYSLIARPLYALLRDDAADRWQDGTAWGEEEEGKKGARAMAVGNWGRSSASGG